jgi:hypothetical protein
MKKNQEDEQTGNCKIEEWEVVVSRDIQVIEVKKMNNDMPGMWQGPLFYSSGDLNIVVPGYPRKQPGRTQNISQDALPLLKCGDSISRILLTSALIN